MDASIFYTVLVLIVAVLFPAYAIAEGSKVKLYLIENPNKLKLVYTHVLIQQVILVLLIFLAFYFNNDSLDEIGLSFLMQPWSILLLTIASGLFFLVMHLVKFSKANLEKIEKKYSKVFYLIPKNEVEYRYAIALSFGVGIFEEIIYRGFLFWQISLYLPFILALLVTNVIFGLLHLGTGYENAVSTFVLGMIYSGLSMYFDTLWIAILAHILTDLYSVCVGYKLNDLKSEI